MDCPVSGRLLVGFQPSKPSRVQQLSGRGHRPYPSHDPDDLNAVLLVRDGEEAPPRTIPRQSWSFAQLEAGRVVADPNHVYLVAGFEPGKIYEVIYTTTGAPVIGLGLLAARDTVSFLRYSRSADDPCAGDIQHAYAFGASQSGRFLRQLLYLGLNEDEAERSYSTACWSHRWWQARRRLQHALRAAVGVASERPVPIQRDGCHRSGQRSARRAPRTPRHAPSCAENLFHQHLVRILARRRFADPHRCERHA